MAAARLACIAQGRTLARFFAVSRRLLRDQRGGSALEFAFVAPILVLLIFGILDVGVILFVDSALEGGIRDASRFGVTGVTSPTETREKQIVGIVNSRLMGLYTLTTQDVTIEAYNNFSGVGQPEPFTDLNHNGVYDPGEPYIDVNGNGRWDADQGVSGAGASGQVVVYQVAINWHPLTPVLLPFLSSGGTIRLAAALAVHNEPF